MPAASTPDRFGNRWQQNPGGPLFTFNNNKNQIDGYQYDASGNVLSDGVNSYTYDAENRLVTYANTAGATASYVYDAIGRRVVKTSNTPNECNGGSTGGPVYYLNDIFGHASIYTANGVNQCTDEIFMGNRHLATYVQGRTTFTHADWLGTERVRATYNTNPPGENCSSLPFGDGLNCGSAADPGYNYSPLHFTGKERDQESNLDYFGARYNSSSFGRFMSPDPPGLVGLPVDSQDPQSWNAYAYVRNNPLNLTDPDGTVFCRAANDAEKGQGVTQVCDVTDAQYVNSSKEQRAAYDKAGYTHFDCSCDSGADKDAWQHPNGNAGKDYVGYAVVFAASLYIVKHVASYFTEAEEEEEGVVIGKVNRDGTLRDTTLKPGERQLELPNQGSPKANWAQNSSKLREAMRDGTPIRDGSAGVPGSESGFLRAERNLLRDHGWELKGDTWYPPNK